jgi:arylsulfatase A-like enzyme
MQRYLILFVTSLTLAVCTTAFAEPASDDRLPNVIYILADDLGYGDLGCYGQELIQTPCLDRMAAEGLRFTQHYSGSTVCAPTRCSLITGLHTGHAYIRGNGELKPEGQRPIPADAQTLSKVMKQAGYVTGCIGKWGLGGPGSHGEPNRQGFDHWFGYLCQRQAHSYYPKHLWRNGEKVILDGNIGGKKQQYSHDLFTEDALEFIRQNKDEKFFLYLPYTIPHTAFQVPELGQYADKPWSEAQRTQAAMISRMDRDIGSLLDLIEELGLDDSTLVMFSSDNGPHAKGGTGGRFKASGPLRGHKRALYEGGIRVPMIARWPGRIAEGSATDHISAQWDLMPTLAELVDANLSQPTDGLSFLPTLMGQADRQAQHPHLYWEFYEQGGKQAVRMGKWKALRLGVRSNPNGPLELYDLETDVGEQRNVAADHPELVEQMAAIMSAEHTPSEIWTFQKKRKKSKKVE